MGNCLLSSLTGDAPVLPSGTPRTNRSNPYVYRRDCRNIVLSRLKYRVWNSIAEKEAAYLLLPYTEKNRQSVEHLLDERFQQYLEAEFADDPRSGWRGQRKENQLSFLTGTVPVLLRFRTRRPGWV